MLIIAMPKSSSSALLATLCRAHGLPNRTAETRARFFPLLAPARGFDQMANFHSDLVEVDAPLAGAAAAPDGFLKFHFPPTPGNEARLARTRKVVLLRDPEEIVRAYRRGDQTGVFALPSHEFCFCFSEQDWLSRARSTGLLDELGRFAEGWRAHRGDKLLVDHEELIAAPAAVLGRIEDYLGTPRSGHETLLRARYTRSSAPATSSLSLLFKRRRLLLRRLVSGSSRWLFGDTTAYDALRDLHRRRRWRRAARARGR